MPSISEWRQPYLLSNFDLVTASLTLMAGNSSSPRSCISTRRWTPVVVSSETPLMPLAIEVHRVGVLGQAAGQHGQHHGELLGVGGRRVRHGTGLLELDALVDEQGGVATVVEDQVRALAAGPAQDLLGAPPVVLEGLALPGEDRARPAGRRRSRRAPRPRRRRRGPGSRRCCSWPTAPRRRGRSSVSISTAVWIVMWSEPVMRAPARGLAAPNSARMAMSPGISCSASTISLRPNSASDRSATLKSWVRVSLDMVAPSSYRPRRGRWSPDGPSGPPACVRAPPSAVAPGPNRCQA